MRDFMPCAGCDEPEACEIVSRCLEPTPSEPEDDFKAAVLRCRYPVCKTIHPSGWGWDTSRLNEVIADHGSFRNDREDV